MLKAIRREDAQVYHLPERDWYLYHGPETGVENMTIGWGSFPEGAAPEGHVHPTQVEIIYITAGHGELVSPENTVALEPGVCVYVPAGLFHATVSNGPGPLEMVTSFSPPIVPGSYEKNYDG
jgi:oxalate decarboxylase/phosphoglucose isomerase-like protein (cupin superfamily)